MGNFFLFFGAAVVAETAARWVCGSKPLFEVQREVVEEPSSASEEE